MRGWLHDQSSHVFNRADPEVEVERTIPKKKKVSIILLYILRNLAAAPRRHSQVPPTTVRVFTWSDHQRTGARRCSRKQTCPMQQRSSREQPAHGRS